MNQIRFTLLTLIAAGSLPAQYSWDFSGEVAVADPVHWQDNGTIQFRRTQGVQFTGSSSGSMIYKPTVSGSNSSDYDVDAQIDLSASDGGSGNYIVYLRANSNTINGCTGTASYVSVEFTNQSGLNVNQCSSGTLTTLTNVAYLSVNRFLYLRAVVWGTQLWVFSRADGSLNPVNPSSYQFITGVTVPLISGQPGVGGSTEPSGSFLRTISIGHHDMIPPGQVNATSIATSVFPTQVSARWQGVQDDSNGIGLYGYKISRVGSTGTSFTPDLNDYTVQPSGAYQYSVQAYDYHGNYSAATYFTAFTPWDYAVDPRRTGVRPTGNYWGGGGEQIDTLSGNLNFSLPLVSPQLRSGISVPLGLTYNSQNWRQDSAINWKLGDDVGYGFGWKAQIGSLTPYSDAWFAGIDYYLFTDASGAEYRVKGLPGDGPGVDSSVEGIYVWFDSTTNRLHFRDGTFWVMSSVSGGTEQDAGTMYPTIIEDVSGNQLS